MAAMQAHEGRPPTGTTVPTPSGPPGPSTEPTRAIAEDRWATIMISIDDGDGEPVGDPLHADTWSVIRRLSRRLIHGHRDADEFRAMMEFDKAAYFQLRDLAVDYTARVLAARKAAEA